MTRAKDISKIVTDANLSGTLDVAGAFTSQGIDDNADATAITIDNSERIAIGTTTNTVYYNSTSTYTSSLALKTNISNEVAEIAIINGNNNFGSTIDFARTNTSSNDVRFASLGGYADSNTAGSESGHIRFQTKGASDSNIAERMRITSAGNVGIGTTAPNTTNLNSGTTSGIVVKSGGVAKNNFVALPSTGGSQWDVRESGGSGGEFSMRMFDTSGTHNVQISSNGNHFFNGGNVGIGTSSPVRAIHVESSDTLVGRFKSTGSTEGFIQLAGSGTSTAPRLGATGNHLLAYTSDTERMRIDSAGHVTMPYQSAFSAKRNGTLTNAANDSYISFVTEAFDQNSDFSGDTFTAPVSGRYQFNFISWVSQIDKDSNWVRFTLETSNQVINSNIIDPGVFASDPAYWNFTIAHLADMDAGDTAKIQFEFDGGVAQADISGHSYFSGYLVA